MIVVNFYDVYTYLHKLAMSIFVYSVANYCLGNAFYLCTHLVLESSCRLYLLIQRRAFSTSVLSLFKVMAMLTHAHQMQKTLSN